MRHEYCGRADCMICAANEVGKEHPVDKLERLLRQMKTVAKELSKENAGYFDAVEHLHNDLHRLSGRLMQIGKK